MGGAESSGGSFVRRPDWTWIGARPNGKTKKSTMSARRRGNRHPPPAAAALLVLVLATQQRGAAAVVAFATSFEESPASFYVGKGNASAVVDWASAAAARTGARGLAVNITRATASGRDVVLMASVCAQAGGG